jgi:hypothetical protein
MIGNGGWINRFNLRRSSGEDDGARSTTGTLALKSKASPLACQVITHYLIYGPRRIVASMGLESCQVSWFSMEGRAAARPVSGRLAPARLTTERVLTP